MTTDPGKSGITPYLLTIPQAGELIGKRKTAAFAFFASGAVPVVVVGGRRMVRRRDLEAWVASLAAA